MMAILTTSLGTFNVLPDRTLVVHDVASARRGAEIVPAPIVEIHRDGQRDAELTAGEVQIELADNEEGAVLSGPTVAQAAGGIATFPGLSINKHGRYRLRALVDEDTLRYPTPGLNMDGAIHGFGSIPDGYNDTSHIGGWDLVGMKFEDRPEGRTLCVESSGRVFSSTPILAGEPGVAAGTVVFWGRLEALVGQQIYLFGLGASSSTANAGRAIAIDHRPNPDRFEIMTNGAVSATYESAWDTSPHVFGITWDGSGIDLFIDGVSVAKTATVPSIIAGDTYRPSLVSFHPNSSASFKRCWYGAGWWPDRKDASWHLAQAQAAGVA